MSEPRQPILANSCRLATSAAEARHRISTPIDDQRTTVLVALDRRAAGVVTRAADAASPRLRLLASPPTSETAADAGSVDVVPSHGNGSGPSHPQARPSGDRRAWSPSSLEDMEQALSGADLVVLVAASAEAAPAARHLGERCGASGVTTAAVVIDADHDELRPVVAALRPHAGMVLWTRDADDLPDLLAALRA
jgi:hypothetical protein